MQEIRRLETPPTLKSQTLTTDNEPLTTLPMFHHRKLMPLADRGPLRVMFVITSMPVGGAETLLVELIRRMDRERFLPELCCLKRLDPLGEVVAKEIPTFTGLLAHKYDFAVLWRLTQLMRQRRIDAVVTVGTGGDKMFWGRLAAWLAGVPVICSALHSTGLPDHVEFSNRLLTPLTDAFVAVAKPHGQYLAEHEGCPAHKIRVIPNGVDSDRFHPRWPNEKLRQEWNLAPDAPVAGIVAALRPEKNHALFLEVAALVHAKQPAARFLIVGDGPERKKLEAIAQSLGLSEVVRFLGTRSDIAEVLSLMDVVLLTSHMEANPICLMEAMASEKPVVATRVGSIPETVLEGQTGYLVAPGDSAAMANRLTAMIEDRELASALGRAGREHVIAHGSVESMVQGYQAMIAEIYTAKSHSVTPPANGGLADASVQGTMAR
jgi:glycosyltransferase involved in cell wall biosynthesis